MKVQKRGRYIAYPGFFCHPTLSYLSLPHPTLYSTAILPHPTQLYTAYPNVPSSLPRPTLDSSALLPCPTLSYPILHCILLPSYHSLPRPTLESYHSLPSRTHPIPKYILAYLVLHGTLLPASILPILPQPFSSYTGLFSHPTLCYPVLPRGKIR